ncbi:hypothetical protein [Ancylobacter terrae]|uniref:hypothetical protein n=1 Tax=Ancylobacter sp. sgz301288 TaxID=3342077 RepID=UPI00385A8014
MWPHLHLDGAAIESFASCEGRVIHILRIDDLLPLPVGPAPLSQLLACSQRLFGGTGDHFAVLPADGFCEPARIQRFFDHRVSRTASCSDVLVFPYADGGLISACHVLLPFQDDAGAAPASWWRPPHDFAARLGTTKKPAG